MYGRRLLRIGQGGHEPEKAFHTQHRACIHETLGDFRRFTHIPARRQHKSAGPPCSRAVAFKQWQQHRVGGVLLSRKRQRNRLADDEIIRNGRGSCQFVILLRAVEITQKVKGQSTIQRNCALICAKAHGLIK